MTATLASASAPRSAYSAATASDAAADELLARFGDFGLTSPRCIIFFAAVAHDGAIIGERLQARFPDAQVVGCSGNGEFTDQGWGKSGVAAIALGGDLIAQAASVLAVHTPGIESSIADAAQRLGAKLGTELRLLDPARWVGIALLEGAKGREEALNEALGNAAPLLSFVGGSAGDNISFTGTWVFAEGRVEKDASVLLVVEMLTPFTIIKTCNFVATPVELTITKADTRRRLILEIDGQPAAQRYAEVIGAKVEELGFAHFLANPLGLMIDGEAWLRSGVRVEGSALFFACAVLEGVTLQLMKATDLVADARDALARAAVPIGGPPRAALLFNCAYRMLEAQLKGVEQPYHQALSQIVHAGLHTNGESYLGHINQTLTGIIFG